MRRGFIIGLCLLLVGVLLGTAQSQDQKKKAKPNPVPSDKKTTDQGEKVAKVNCASCHGAKGKGDGAAAIALTPKPADWTSAKVQDETDGELFWKITNGNSDRGMPSFSKLPELQRWQLVLYLRTLKPTDSTPAKP